MSLKTYVFPSLLLLLISCTTIDDRPRSSVIISGTDSDDPASTDPDDTTPDDGDETDDPPDTVDTTPITSPECENEGELYCDFECIRPITNDHCRQCNRRCSAGLVCMETGGVWDCGCADGTLRCGGSCIDPLTSAQFCGASGTCMGIDAGVACGTNAECVSGACQCLPTHADCGGECVNPLTDIRYCGTVPDQCGNPCMPGGVCDAGHCECPPALPTECSTGCVDPMTDNNACGGCVGTGGEQCDTPNGFTCQEGSCQCAPGLTLCEGECVNTASDPDNCGGCFNGGGGPGIACGYVDAPANTIRRGCFVDQCVDSPCDPLVMGTRCEGLTPRLTSACFTTDDHFTIAGIKCDNNPAGIPRNTAVCYEIRDVPSFTGFRCWWSGRSLTVNGTLMSCSNAGNLYLSLPPSVGGSYCVYFPPSSTDGAESDGFSMGIR